jgi:hypothetical protein
MSGFFMDWDGNLRSVDDPGGGYSCDVDTVARYVAVMKGSFTKLWPTWKKPGSRPLWFPDHTPGAANVMDFSHFSFKGLHPF